MTRLLIAVSVLLVADRPASAQPATQAAPTAPQAEQNTNAGGDDANTVTRAISKESVEQLRQQVEAATDLDADLKQQILDTCQKALETIARSVKLESQTPLNQTG